MATFYPMWLIHLSIAGTRRIGELLIDLNVGEIDIDVGENDEDGSVSMRAYGSDFKVGLFIRVGKYKLVDK
jgi:hypothetical protein